LLELHVHHSIKKIGAILSGYQRSRRLAAQAAGSDQQQFLGAFQEFWNGTAQVPVAIDIAGGQGGQRQQNRGNKVRACGLISALACRA
jgi:hypothetical protein